MRKRLQKFFPDLHISKPFIKSCVITQDPLFHFIIIFKLKKGFGLIKRTHQGYSKITKFKSQKKLIKIAQKYFYKI